MQSNSTSPGREQPVQRALCREERPLQIAKTGTQMPPALEALCTTGAQKVQDFNAQDIANMF